MKTFFKKLIFFVCFILVGAFFVACGNIGTSSSTPSSSEQEKPSEHQCRFEIEHEEKATCEHEGHIIYTCECGEEKEEIIPPIDHEFSDWSILVHPTHEEAGLESRYCIYCSIEENRSIPKLEGGEDNTDNPENPENQKGKMPYLLL